MTRILPSAVTVFLIAGLFLKLVASTSVERADFALANGADPKSLDPVKVSGSIEGRILRALLDGLTAPHPVTLDPLPALARSWAISPDGRRYTFLIRENARWSNGARVTADDFVWSWRRLLEKGQYQDLLWSVVGAKRFSRGEVGWSEVGIRADSPTVLRVELRHPTPYFLPLTSFYPLYPLHRSSVEAAERAGVRFTSPEHFVESGPFLLVERRLRDRIRLRRNPDYWDRQAVAIETLDVLAAESPNTQLNLFLSGEVDWISAVPQAVIPHLRRDPRFREVYRPVPYLATYFYRLNVTRPPLDDSGVRHALSLAIDRLEITESVTQAGEQPAWSFVPWPAAALERQQASFPRAESDHDPSPVPFARYRRAYATREIEAPETRAWDRLGYDPAAARALLEARGYRVPRRDEAGNVIGFGPGQEMPTLEILYNSSPLHERIAEVVQAQWWRELGIPVKLTNQEYGSYLNAQQRLDYTVSRSIWIGDYLDPSTFLEIFFSDSPNNRTGWKSKAYDDLLHRAQRTPKPQTRFQLLHGAESILMDELPILPLYYCVTEGMSAAEGVGSNALNVVIPKHLPRRVRP